ncbi:hypothetical protein [Siminovitchia terrae]|uniref:hypothetical protein n=1 Tax=Siminovitchia terrae TaxID=1914933 RepID=UPI0028AC0D05|nr:hypothetical protein [Siminovitchia terrae]
MDKERLEETQEHLVAVKNLVDKYKNCYDKDIALKYCRDLMRYHTKWLIQQAERVEEQQKEIEMYKNLVAKGTERRVEDNKEWFDAQSVLVEENARLRVALEFYADENKYEFETIVSDCDIEVESKILEDGGEKARQALKE